MNWDYNTERDGAMLTYRGYRAWARRAGDGVVFDADGAVIHRVAVDDMDAAMAKIEAYLRDRLA